MIFSIEARLAVLVLSLASAGHGKPPVDEDMPGIEKKMDVSARDEAPARIRGGETHRRVVALDRDDFLQVIVEQRGIDVSVALVDAAGAAVWEVDSPNSTDGPEELVAVAPAAGRYHVEVRASGADIAGSYVYRQLARRPATRMDRELVAGDRAYHDLRKQYLRAPQAVVEGLSPIVELWRKRALYHREADTRIPLCRAYQSLGQAAAALNVCEPAITWYRAAGASYLLALTLRHAALAHMRLGEPRQALERLREALALSEGLDRRDGVFLSWIRFGEAYSLVGELQSALDAFEKAMANSSEKASSRALAISGRAAVLLELRRSEEALASYREAVDIYRQLKRPKDVALALDGLARAALAFGDLPRAEEAAREALRTLLPLEDPRTRAIVLITLGRTLRQKSDSPAARKAFENALQLSHDVKDLRGQAFASTELGDLLLAQGQGEEALARHQRALRLFLDIEDIRGEATSRVRGAEALRSLGRLAEAWELFAPALDRIETLRAATARSDFRLTYFAFRQEYYTIGLDLLADLHAKQPTGGWDAQGVAVNDRRRARELLDAVVGAGEAADPALKEKQRVLERRLRAVVAKDPVGAPSEGRQQQIADLLARLHQIRGNIRRNAAKSTPSAQPALDIDAVQKLLGSDSVLLIYALGEEGGHLWALTDRERQTRLLPGRGAIEPMAREFVDQLQIAGDREPGYRLRDLLLTPVADLLRDRQRLIVVADGELQTIPFAALPLPNASDAGVLIERHEIVMLPSVATLLARRRRPADRDTPAGWMALFADPIFESADPRIASSATSTQEAAMPEDLTRTLRDLRAGQLKRLRGSEAEARAIHDLIGPERASIHLGLEVDREKVLETLTRHRIVHFATHALSHPRAELSGLVLSLVDAHGRPVDGFLHAFEIARLEVAADLVVLSACETGRGEYVGGEGALGLAWSFLHAGAPRIVASLWQVSDTSTARLMIRFYQHLDNGLAPPAALRQAQLAMAAEPRSTPYNWAGFVFQGDWRRPDWPRPSQGETG